MPIFRDKGAIKPVSIETGVKAREKLLHFSQPGWAFLTNNCDRDGTTAQFNKTELLVAPPRRLSRGAVC